MQIPIDGLLILAETGGILLMFSMSSSLYKFQLEKDVPYLGDGRTEKLDLYLPVAEGAKPLRGGVVWSHGGGWYAGR